MATGLPTELLLIRSDSPGSLEAYRDRQLLWSGPAGRSNLQLWWLSQPRPPQGSLSQLDR